MKKLDIVNKISRDCNLDKKFVAIVVENFMTEIKDSLINGENIYLRGFGTFRLKKRAKKTARNNEHEVGSISYVEYACTYSISQIVQVWNYRMKANQHKESRIMVGQDLKEFIVQKIVESDST